MSLNATYIRNIVAIVLVLTAVAVGAWWGQHTPDERVCRRLDIRITDSDMRNYVTADELTRLLRQQSLYPVGQRIQDIPLQAIEDAVRAHDMVRTAQCYANTDSIVVLTLTQRIPLLKVITATESYCIDTDRERMPVVKTEKNAIMPVVGHIGERMAKNELADMVVWIMENTYWRDHITRIEMQEGKQMILYQHSPAPRIQLGKMDDYRGKLHRVRIFQETLPAQLPDMPAYKELDVRYQGQVIGRK